MNQFLNEQQIANIPTLAGAPSTNADFGQAQRLAQGNKRSALQQLAMYKLNQMGQQHQDMYNAGKTMQGIEDQGQQATPFDYLSLIAPAYKLYGQGMFGGNGASGGLAGFGGGVRNGQ